MKCVSCNREIKRGSLFCNHCGAEQPQQTAAPPTRHGKSANGTGYAYKRGNTWTVRYRRYVGVSPDPSHTSPACVERTKGGFKKKADALAYLSKLSITPKKEQKLTIAHYWNVYAASELPTLSHSKQVNYKTAYNRLEPIHDAFVSDLTVSDLRNAANVCPTYYPRKDVQTVLSILFRLAAADSPSVQKDLPSFIILPPRNEKEQQAFTAEEVASIYSLSTTGHRMASFMLLMIYTSMMPGELLRLRTEMIDLQHRTIIGAGIKTKQRKQSAIVFPAWLIPTIQRLITQSVPHDGLIAYDYTYQEKFVREFKQTCQLAGCRTLTPYSCRHTTQTVLGLDPSTSAAERAAVMRHSVRMEDRYTHIENVFARNASDRMLTPDQLVQRKKSG